MPKFDLFIITHFWYGITREELVLLVILVGRLGRRSTSDTHLLISQAATSYCIKYAHIKWVNNRGRTSYPIATSLA